MENKVPFDEAAINEISDQAADLIFEMASGLPSAAETIQASILAAIGTVVRLSREMGVPDKKVIDAVRKMYAANPREYN
jgi:hypothetical protein